MTLSDRKEKLRRRWANSKAANDMSVLDFGRFLTALDKARSHDEVARLAKKWKERTQPQGAQAWKA